MAAPEWKAQSFTPQIDTLQNMLNEILFETGKAIKARRKNGAGDIRQVANVINTNTKSQYRTFQNALSELLAEVQDAKVVCIRDLERVRAKRGPPPPTAGEDAGPRAAQHNPVPGAFPASSLPHLPARPQAPPDTSASQKLMAPFPDMGGGEGMAAPVAPLTNIKLESPIMTKGSSMPLASAAAHTVKLETNPGRLAATVPGATPNPNASNFTKMQFTIAAPPSQAPAGPAAASVGRAETANMGDGLDSLFMGEGLQDGQRGQFNDAHFSMG